MAIFRTPVDYFTGSLQNPIASSDTSMSSLALASLPDTLTLSTTQVLPITIHDPSRNAYEIVWVTGHDDGASIATIARGKEGSGAQPWPAGTQIICAPTVGRDGLAAVTSTTWPADAQVGLRGVETDTGLLKEQTANQGPLGTLHANIGDIGKAIDGTSTIPDGYEPIFKGWYATGTTDASGMLNSAIPGGGFPNKLIGATANRVISNVFYLTTIQPNSTKSTVILYCATPSNGPVANQAGMGLFVMAVGY
jgi:hypothetical protein